MAQFETNDVNRTSNYCNFENEIFKINSIEFNNVKKNICMQSENGPCPLIAIFNVLLLNGELFLSDLTDYITGKEMVNMVAEYLVHKSETDLHEQLNIVSQLNSGLMVNPIFRDVTDFDLTSGLSLFEALNIPLYHCWLMDPDALPETNKNLCDLSYEQAMLSLVPGANWSEIVGLESMNDDENSVCEARRCLEQFLSETKSVMMSFRGLSRLQNVMAQDSLGVLFHSSHFSVVYHREHQNPSTPGLFLLCTDIGYSEDPRVVWQTLNSLSGDTDLVDSCFHPVDTTGTELGIQVSHGTEIVQHGTGCDSETLDEQLARKFAMEDDMAFARQIQLQEDAKAAAALSQSCSSSSGGGSPDTLENHVIQSPSPLHHQPPTPYQQYQMEQNAASVQRRQKSDCRIL